MLGNVEFERSQLEATYYDKANIYRFVKNKVDGETKINLQIEYENQACALSKKTLSSNNQSESVNAIVETVTLFIAPELDIKQGDVVEIEHLGRLEKYKAGKPFCYITHQEISLFMEDRA